MTRVSFNDEFSDNVPKKKKDEFIQALCFDLQTRYIELVYGYKVEIEDEISYQNLKDLMATIKEFGFDKMVSDIEVNVLK